MRSKILLGCFEIPGYGGANTASYRLFEKMQADGLDVAYVNLIDSKDAEFFTYCYGRNSGNPRHLADVHNHVLEAPFFDPQPRLARLIEALSPTLLLADGHIATLFFKRATPQKGVVYMTGGLAQISSYLAERRRRDPFTLDEFLSQCHEGLTVFHPDQKAAIEAADLIITHADLIRNLLLKIFPLAAGKIYPHVIWRAEWIIKDVAPYTHLAQPMEQRDIDLIFVASSWQRPEKNYRMVRKIVSRLRGKRIHIVGETARPLAGATCHGLITDRAKLFALMGRAKTLVSVSDFDAAPAVLWEGALMGCNVIAPKTCGNWRLCHPALVAHPNRLETYLTRIEASLERRYEDNLAFFKGLTAYADLLDILNAVCREGL